MDTSNLSPFVWILLGGSLGLVVGLVPLIAGFVKKNTRFALLGFACSIVGGAILGLLLAVPVAAVFTWLILRKPKAPAEVVVVDQNPIDVSLNDPTDQ